jgi:riboflavin-specific deaminase-like protein
MVGIGTVLKDNPQLTVRDVPGASPLRVILDSDLSTPHDARVLDGEAATLIFTGPESDPARREELRRRGVRVEVINRDQEGLSVAEALHRLAEIGVGSVLVEGGSGVITSFLASGFADRFIVSIAPTVIGKGTEAVSDLGTARVADGIPLTNRSLLAIEDDLILAWDVENEAMSLSDHVVDRESREIAV